MDKRTKELIVAGRWEFGCCDVFYFTKTNPLDWSSFGANYVLHHLVSEIYISSIHYILNRTLFFNFLFFIYQVIHDEVLSQEIEQHRVSESDGIPLPLKKYLTTLALQNGTNLEGRTASSIAVRSCMRDLYHYARISGTHVLECIMDTALSAIRREQLQEAGDVCGMFPVYLHYIFFLLFPGLSSCHNILDF